MVIQRWQSVLLLLACILMACFTFLSLGQIQTEDFSYNFTTLGISYEGEPTDGAPTGYLPGRPWILFVVSLMSAVIPLIAIFCFGNLKLQKRLCWIEILFIMVASAIAVKTGYSAPVAGEIQWSSMIVAAPVSLVAVIAAYRCIVSDHRKLRSADRLR